VTDLQNLFATGNQGAQRMTGLLNMPSVSQITCDRFDRIMYVDQDGPKRVEAAFASSAEYVDWLNQLMSLTDVGYTDVENANVSVIEGSFRSDRVSVHGSIHICTRELTRGEPTLTIRKQPISLITLDDMLNQGMLSPEMRQFLEMAIRGRSNILISGGSGAGKTTLARALSYFIDPWNRVITCEEIDELHLYDRLTNCVPLTTFRRRGADGELLRETSLQDLVRESLRMRGDRVWVGETRGQEAYALVKAANSGHDGSVTTLHADSGKQATKQLSTYVMESGLTEQVAREQVAEAFDLVVQISKVRMDRRVITEIAELESVIEGGSNQRLNPLFSYDHKTDTFRQEQHPSRRFVDKWARYGVQVGNAQTR
jgi:pilus assembly protein CpaF